MGWFGPIGVGAVYYIEVALQAVPDDHTREHLRRTIAPVVLFCVFSSVVTHGVTIPLIYFGPHVVRHTRTLTITRTSESAERRSKSRSFFQRLGKYFTKNDKEPPTATNVSAPLQVGELDHYIPEHKPFSREKDGEQPPDLALHPHGRMLAEMEEARAITPLDSQKNGNTVPGDGVPSETLASSSLPKPVPPVFALNQAGWPRRLLHI